MRKEIILLLVVLIFSVFESKAELARTTIEADLVDKECVDEYKELLKSNRLKVNSPEVLAWVKKSNASLKGFELSTSKVLISDLQMDSEEEKLRYDREIQLLVDSCNIYKYLWVYHFYHGDVDESVLFFEQLIESLEDASQVSNVIVFSSIYRSALDDVVRELYRMVRLNHSYSNKVKNVDAWKFVESININSTYDSFLTTVVSHYTLREVDFFEMYFSSSDKDKNNKQRKALDEVLKDRKAITVFKKNSDSYARVCEMVASDSQIVSSIGIGFSGFIRPQMRLEILKAAMWAADSHVKDGVYPDLKGLTDVNGVTITYQLVGNNFPEIKCVLDGSVYQAFESDIGKALGIPYKGESVIKLSLD